ncbi:MULTISPECIES: GNAT family N-acetyltransferase [Ornithinibacillus]|uniref:GNAT family N-acetyltransferase n=2 Tax=Ornithinibacillus TaxID=484508 RepID=A0A923RHV9_9BACI|nr:MULTISPECIES: GNAT family N-acetyltransferase [Ornithinibacillus]MBC5636815.1 GNAT family N-acetyltransferase [Ornithinibacillus hominis]MBS3681381.1 GNAT family N-acetyltransferase [Ornithinibacillus massiliensis]
MNPILIDFPSEFETERLHIRMPMPGDGKAVHESKQASKKELLPWMPWAQHEEQEEDTEINIRQAHVAFLNREDLRLLVFHKETGVLIANSGLHRIDWDARKFEIGYWIDTRYSGKGYMTEAVKGIADFAFRELEANRVEIRCDAKNVKSRAIAERIGFELEGILHKDSLDVYGQELRDTCIYAKVK